MAEQREHEFTAADNEVLNAVSVRMRIFAYLLILSVVLSLLVTGFQLVSMGVTGGGLVGGMGSTAFSTIISLVIAFLTLSASGSLATAARTSGNDVASMMNALYSLKRLYGIQYWLIYLAGLTFFNARWSNKVRVFSILAILISYTVLYLFFKTPDRYQFPELYYGIFHLLSASFVVLVAIGITFYYYVWRHFCLEKRTIGA